MDRKHCSIKQFTALIAVLVFAVVLLAYLVSYERKTTLFNFFQGCDLATAAAPTTPNVVEIVKTETVTSTIRSKGSGSSKSTLPRVAICITGQRERLELESKIEHIFKTSEVVLDLFFVMSNDTAQYTNDVYEETAGPDFTQLNQQLSSLRPLVGMLEYTTVEQPQDVVKNRLYVNNLDKAKTVDPNGRARNHVRQFYTLNRCYDRIKEAEFRNNARYDMLVKIREDLYFLRKFKFERFITQRVKKPTVWTSKCDSWGGVNDKMAIISRGAGKAYFEGPLEYHYLFGYKLSWSTIENPENFLREVLTKEKVDLRSLSPKSFPYSPSMRSSKKRSFCLKLYSQGKSCLSEALPNYAEQIYKWSCTSKD